MAEFPAARGFADVPVGRTATSPPAGRLLPLTQLHLPDRIPSGPFLLVASSGAQTMSLRLFHRGLRRPAPVYSRRPGTGTSTA